MLSVLQITSIVVLVVLSIMAAVWVGYSVIYTNRKRRDSLIMMKMGTAPGSTSGSTSSQDYKFGGDAGKNGPRFVSMTSAPCASDANAVKRGRIQSDAVAYTVAKYKRKRDASSDVEAQQIVEMNENESNSAKNCNTATSSSRGVIKYNLEYDFNRENLIIFIKSAENLPAMDLNGTSDPFVKVFLNKPKKQKFETKVISKCLNPIFNQRFCFEVKYSDLKIQTLHMIVCDFDRFSSHDQIGFVKLQLSDLDFGQAIIQRCDSIQLPISLNPAAKKIQNDKLGEICFSIKFVPNSNKLTVVILEAKGLKKMDFRGLSDPYVKIAIYLNKKRIKKKKTTIKKCTLNPYFNEAFTFEISPQIIDNIELVITVVDYDRIGNSDKIGQVMLSSQVTGYALTHWIDMLANPRQPIAQWHALGPMIY